MQNKRAHIAHQLLSFLLVVLLLFSSVGMSIDIHFCQNKIKSIGIMAPAQTCGADMDLKACGTSNEPALSKKSCCSNGHYAYQTSEVRLASSLMHMIAPPYIGLLPNYDKPSIDALLSEIECAYYSSAPPPYVISDFNILYDTFLI